MATKLPLWMWTHGTQTLSISMTTCSQRLQGLALLTLSWDKNWDSHSLVNGYPSFYPRIALVAPSPDLYDMEFVSLTLQGNPLVCDQMLCSLRMLPFNKTTASIDDFTCSSPSALKGSFGMNVHPTLLGCYNGKYVLRSYPYICTYMPWWFETQPYLASLCHHPSTDDTYLWSFLIEWHSS